MTPHLSIVEALALSSLVILNNREAVEPLIKLLVGMTDPRGDPLRVAVREAVLDSLYSKTEDARFHRRCFTGEHQDEKVIQANFSASSVSG